MLPRNHVLQNRYRIIRPLGHGGMGTVYEAMDDAVDCVVAIKETFANTEKMLKAFEREAKLLANLRHPVLPRVTHHFLEGDGQFLVMDFIEGDDLAALLKKRRHPFDYEEAAELADKLLSALDYLHNRPEPIIHRDIKPANIKISNDAQPFLLDFGLAKGSAGQMSTVDPEQSAFSSVFGYTAAYAPLEQLTNAGTNAQSDLYSLGATLYHMLTGQPPISASVRYEGTEMGAGDPQIPAHVLNPSVPEGISEVIAHAMAMSRRDRLGNARTMREAFREARRAASESAVTKVRQTIPNEVSSEAAPPVNSFDEPRAPAPTMAAPTGVSPTIAAPNVVAGSAAPHRVEVTPVPHPTIAAPTSAAPPSAEVSWPSQINNSDSPGVASRAPEISAARGTAASETERSRDVAPMKTIVASKPAVSQEISEQSATALSFLPPEKRMSGTAKIVIICSIVMVLAGLGLWLYFSSASETSDTAKTNASSTPTPKPLLALPATYAFQRDVQTAKGAVWSVAYLPNGKFFSNAGADQYVYSWNGRSFDVKCSGKLGDANVINSIAYSPDSNNLAIARNDKTVELEVEPCDHDTADINRMASRPSALRGHTDEVYFVTFSPDGKALASASKDKTVKLWDVQSGKEIKSFVGHTDVVWSVAFSPDGKTLASASKDRTINLWNAQDGYIRTLTPYTLAVISLAFSPDGKLLASGGDDNAIKLWDTTTWQEVRTMTGHTGYITSLAFTADGQVLASASNDNTIKLWNAKTGDLRQTLTGHTKGVTSVAFSPDGKTIISGGKDGAVKVWQ